MRATVAALFLTAIIPMTRITLQPRAVLRNTRSDSVGQAVPIRSLIEGADTALRHPKRPPIDSLAPQLKIAHWVHAPSWAPVKFGDGHIYVLDFTALWCGSCPPTYPILQDVLKQYGSQGVRVVFVTAQYGQGEDHETLTPQQELDAFPAYFARHHVAEPVAVYSSFKDLTHDYSDDGRRMALPKIVIIDGKGVVKEAMTGWQADKARAQVFRTVAELLKAPAP